MMQVSLHCSDIFSSIGLLSYFIPFSHLVQNRIISQHSLKLFSKGRHVYSDRSAKAIHRCIPDMLHQFLLAYRSAHVQKQIFQNTIFFSCQRYHFSFCISLTPYGIKLYLTAFQTYILLYKLPSGQTSDTCLKLL